MGGFPVLGAKDADFRTPAQWIVRGFRALLAA
jgi:hypothetical protein